MSLTIVNGYPCRDCTEIAKAKRGENPNPSPTDEAQKAGQAAKPGETKPGDATQGADAVSFGGSLSDLRDAPSRAATAPGVGARVDLLA